LECGSSTASIAYVSVDVEMADNITHRTFAIGASQCILWWYAYKVVISVRVYRICVLFRPRKLVQVPKQALGSICIFFLHHFHTRIDEDQIGSNQFCTGLPGHRLPMTRLELVSIFWFVTLQCWNGPRMVRNLHTSYFDVPKGLDIR
jgi:hypothetical protein